MPSLEPRAAIDMMMDAGVEKLTRDYVSTFIGESHCGIRGISPTKTTVNKPTKTTATKNDPGISFVEMQLDLHGRGVSINSHTFAMAAAVEESFVHGIFFQVTIWSQ